MLRAVLSKAVSVTRPVQKTQLLKCLSVAGVQNRQCTTSSRPPVTHCDTELDDNRLIEALKSNDITGWDIRAIVNATQEFDEILSPAVVDALMSACRKVNDYALAVRILETVKDKCGKEQQTYTSIIQAIRPTLDKLGILTPEQMGYDKPELYLKDAFDIHK